eukprot:scaffold108760_cov15-Tisochrysis_lutea.AAC.1
MAKDDRAHYKVHEIKTLGYEEDAQALKLLRDAAYQVPKIQPLLVISSEGTHVSLAVCLQVQPLMRRRNWVVPTLK